MKNRFIYFPFRYLLILSSRLAAKMECGEQICASESEHTFLDADALLIKKHSGKSSRFEAVEFNEVLSPKILCREAALMPWPIMW